MGSLLITPGYPRVGDMSALRVLWKLIGANMNSTADQAFTKVGTFNTWIVPIAGGFGRLVNPSTSLTTAVGGVYSATGKGGDALVANTQVYSGATGPTLGANLSITAAGSGLRSDSAIYLSLTTPQGGAATADIYVVGVAIS